MFTALMMYGAATASVFTLRRRRPDLARPYRVWGYPMLPALYLLAVFLLLANAVLTTPFESLAGIGILAAGLPVYVVWRRRVFEGQRSHD
jgi:APA family basic amino acid/polyamine antiporter